MQKKLVLAIITIVLAIITHGYLTSHYYPLKYGAVTGKSACNLNDKFDCDVAAASPFSNIADVPLSVFGLVFHGVLLILVLMAAFNIVSDREKYLRWSTVLAGSSVVASVLLAIISATQLSAWCPFCIAAYAWSFLIFFFLRGSLKEPLLKVTSEIGSLFGDAKAIGIALIAIPAISFVTHKAISKEYGGDKLDRMVHSVVAEWKVNPQHDFSTVEAAYTKGPADSKMKLVEFADFRCGHCGHASPSILAFLKAHPDVQFQFFNFPLDGECNEAIPQGDGISCRIAATVICSEKAKHGAGADLARIAFENQISTQKSRKVGDLDEVMKGFLKEVSLDWGRVQECIESPETKALLQSQSKLGESAGLKGTPTFYVNGRKLSRGQLIPVLKKVYNSL